MSASTTTPVNGDNAQCCVVLSMHRPFRWRSCRYRFRPCHPKTPPGPGQTHSDSRRLPCGIDDEDERRWVQRIVSLFVPALPCDRGADLFHVVQHETDPSRRPKRNADTFRGCSTGVDTEGDFVDVLYLVTHSEAVVMASEGNRRLCLSSEYRLVTRGDDLAVDHQ